MHSNYNCQERCPPWPGVCLGSAIESSLSLSLTGLCLSCLVFTVLFELSLKRGSGVLNAVCLATDSVGSVQFGVLILSAC